MVDSGANLSVLVVDDEGIINQLIQSRLEGLGYRVVGSASDGEEALQQTLALHPDVVMMDLQMIDPETGKEDIRAGITATRKIYRNAPTPVIILTAHESPELLQEASEAGAGAYLLKPAQDDEIQRSILIAQARFSDMMKTRRLNEELLRVNIELQNEVNQRKMTEYMLRRQSLTFEHMFDGVIITDEHFLITDWNPAAERIFGYQKHEVIGKSPEIIHRLDDRPFLQKEIEKSIQEHDLWREVMPFRKRDDSEGFLESAIVPLRDPDGQLILTIGVNRDISERKNAERELARERFLIQMLLDNMPDAIFFKDTDGCYTSINIAGAKRFQLPAPEDIQGKTDFDYYAEETAKEFREQESTVLRTGNPLINQMAREVWRDGRVTKIVHTRIPLKDERGSILGIFGVVSDMTEKIAMEIELTRRNEAMAQSNQELEHFAAIASHDLQEPLRKVCGFVDLLTSRYKDNLDERGQEYLARILDGATRMQAMITSLLAYTRIEDGEKEPVRPVNLEEVLQEVEDFLEAKIRETGARITHSELPTLMVGQFQMVHIFQNLICNAIKFRSADPPEIHISAWKANGVQSESGDSGKDKTWTFSIQDNGIGISSENYDKIFILFERLHGKSEYPGSGLGLAICKKIVERMGGKIWVESQPGKGSTFYFTLPDNDQSG